MSARRRACAFRRSSVITLSSGATLLTVEHRDVPVLAVLALVPAGSAADPPDRPGLSALVADLLDEGAGARSSLEFHDALARIGGQMGIRPRSGRDPSSASRRWHVTSTPASS